MKSLHERFPAKKVSDSALHDIAARARSAHAKASSAGSSSDTVSHAIARSNIFVTIKLWMAGRNIGVLDLVALGAIAFICVSLLGMHWHSNTNGAPKELKLAQNKLTRDFKTGRSTQAGDGVPDDKTPKPTTPDVTPPAPPVSATIVDRQSAIELRQASEEQRDAAERTPAPADLFDNAVTDERTVTAPVTPWPSSPSNEMKDRVKEPAAPYSRNLATKINGGSKATLAATDVAARWLAYHQEADGHWDSRKYGAANKVDTAVTALSLLAMLRAGHNTRVGEYKENVRRAVAWLIGKQHPNGLIFDETDASAHRGIGYPGAIAALALCEAAARAPSKQLSDAAQLAVNYAGLHQQGEGAERSGWRYSAKTEGDLCVSTWWIAALKAAKLAQLNAPLQCFDGAIKFIDSVETKNAGVSQFAYQPGKETNKRRCAMGLYCRKMLGWNPADLRSSAEAFVNDGGVPAWGNNGESVDLYYWYYGTLATFQPGGELWNRWNDGLKKALIENQCKQGDDSGSWHVVGDFAGEWGRTGQTALGCLCLDIYLVDPNGRVPRAAIAAELVAAIPAVVSDEVIRNKLKTHVSFEFVDKPMPKVVEFLNDVCGVKFELSPEAKNANAPITLRVTDMELELAMQWICKLADIDYQITGGRVLIGAPQPVKKGYPALTEIEIGEKLKTPVSVDFANMQIADALEFFGGVVKLNIGVAPESTKKELEVTLIRANTPLGDILQQIGKYRIENGGILVIVDTDPNDPPKPKKSTMPQKDEF